MATPTITVQPATRRPRKGGISSVADFRLEPRLMVGALPVYDALPCSFAQNDVSLCYAPNVDASDKTAEGIDTGEGIGPTFGGYVGVQCFVGPWDDYAERARITLEQSRDRVVETAVSEYLIANATGGPSADLVGAIAQLEQFADQEYVGLPVLWMSRANAVLAAAAFGIFPDDSYDGRLWTANGTPVVASGSFLDTDIYITSSLTVLHSEVVVREGLDLTHNLNMAIAEQAYNIIFDCGNYAINATITTP